MAEIKEMFNHGMLFILIIIGILLIWNFALYYFNELYSNGTEALINVFVVLIIAELMVIRPIEKLCKVKERSELCFYIH